jgi:DNA-binding transcriptional regulator YdaS (Cro superfamily)
MTRGNLRIAYGATTPKTAAQFEMQGSVYFRLLIIACCASQDDYSDRFGVPPRTVSRWVSGETAVPYGRVLQLEAYARECGVVAEQFRKAA